MTHRTNALRHLSSSPLAARYEPKSCNSKLAPVDEVPLPGSKRPGIKAHGPYVATTAVSTMATCPEDCAFRTSCYYLSGLTKGQAKKLNEAADGLTSSQVIHQEVELIDRAFGDGPIKQDGARGGRDLRLHVGGDVGCEDDARALAGAAARWVERGGGTVWTYTHRWREAPRVAWGCISVLASVELPEDIEVARQAGYSAALVVASFTSERSFHLPGTTTTIVPCPYETRGVTCIECRLCLDRDLLNLNVAIAFKAHGPTAKKARAALVQLRLGAQERSATGNKSSGRHTSRVPRARELRMPGGAA